MLGCREYSFIPRHDIMFGVWCATGATELLGPILLRPTINTITLHIFKLPF